MSLSWRSILYEIANNIRSKRVEENIKGLQEQSEAKRMDVGYVSSLTNGIELMGIQIMRVQSQMQQSGAAAPA